MISNTSVLLLYTIVTATVAAFFDANATGKLAFLGNIVAVYKDIIYNKDGTDKVVAWEWK